MASRAFSQGEFLRPESSPEVLDKQDASFKYRHPTVYDAVAGRISATGFIPKYLFVSKNRDTTSTSTKAAPPEAVLFRSKSAPTRYAESDIYFANERTLRDDLPESDLLKAIHCYASDFYSRATSDAGAGDWKSLDETALIAFGVLLEEASRDILGPNGDLVFTEGEQAVESQGKKTLARRSKSKERPAKKRRIGTND